MSSIGRILNLMRNFKDSLKYFAKGFPILSKFNCSFLVLNEIIPHLYFIRNFEDSLKYFVFEKISNLSLPVSFFFILN